MPTQGPGTPHQPFNPKAPRLLCRQPPGLSLYGSYSPTPASEGLQASSNLFLTHLVNEMERKTFHGLRSALSRLSVESRSPKITQHASARLLSQQATLLLYFRGRGLPVTLALPSPSVGPTPCPPAPPPGTAELNVCPLRARADARRHLVGWRRRWLGPHRLCCFRQQAWMSLALGASWAARFPLPSALGTGAQTLPK